MNVQQSLSAMLENSSRVLNAYIEDLSREDLMHKPAEGCNHLAWQLGHLIVSENNLIQMVRAGSGVELPADFVEHHGRQAFTDNDPSHFCDTKTYIELFDKVHAATHKLIASLNEADLDEPAPEMVRGRFPTMGHLMTLIAMHPMMHAGQFVPVRRTLGKPVTI
jgi:hypothetical protein